MSFAPSALRLIFAFAVLAGWPAAAQPSAGTPGHAVSEFDVFMEKVLARRDVNRRMLEDYVLDEEERLHILAPGRVPLHRTRREYTWYVRDGMHVRSPVRINGVAVGEEARDRYEAEWGRRERERRERIAKGGKEPREVTVGPDGVQVEGGAAAVAVEPRFVSEAYFLEFKFEPGNYYLAGRERLEGQDVLRVEYYPTRMFGDDEQGDRGESEPEASARGRDERSGRAEQDHERQIERRLNKTALVTLWIDPLEHQIVRYTFDNVWLDFLPGAWLVRVDEIRASMTMGQPFPGVWLPREMQVEAGVTLASGSFEVGYERAFAGYRLAEVTTRIGPPKGAEARPRPNHPRDRSPRRPPPAARQPGPAAALLVDQPALSSMTFPVHPFTGAPIVSPIRQFTGLTMTSRQPASSSEEEVIAEIRVHGNVLLGDDEVIELAGVAVGQPMPAGGADAITRRLSDSRKFDAIDVRKRYRSLTSTTDVALVLVVHERPGVRPAAAEGARAGLPDGIARPAGRLRNRLMFLPVVGYADGYGFTYGGRFSTIDLLGGRERLSVPLTWGGTRRVALEFERLFESGPLTRIESSAAIWNRENPRFDIRDQRVEVTARAERVFADLLRADLSASRSTIDFGVVHDRVWTLGTSVALDTRLDPSFPANAVFLGAGWTGLHFRSTGRARINRYSADARGYLRLVGQLVLAARAQYTGAGGRLPPYERLLLGGAPTLRGFRAGAFDGDRMLISSAELRLPITSVLSRARVGVTAFIDAGTAWDSGDPLRGARWQRGVGGGLFLMASILKINLDVARGLDTGRTRVHLSSGFSF